MTLWPFNHLSLSTGILDYILCPYRAVVLCLPTLARQYVGIHRRMPFMSSSLLLQQCPTCSVCLIWMVLVIGGRWPYSCCFAGYCFQDLFTIACNILVQIPVKLFLSIRWVNIHVVRPYSRIDTTTAWNKLRFILSDRPNFYMIDNLSIAAHAFARRILCMLFPS